MDKKMINEVERVPVSFAASHNLIDFVDPSDKRFWSAEKILEHERKEKLLADRLEERDRLRKLLKSRLLIERKKRNMPNLTQPQLDKLIMDENDRVLQELSKSPTYPFVEAKKRRLAASRILFPPTRKSTPTPPLVGVEENPGPGKGKNKKQSRQVARARAPAPIPVRRNRARKSKGMGPVQITSQPAPVSIGYKSVMRNKMRNTVINHCEQVAEVVAANGSTYSLQIPLQINPGLAATFPWLSQIASNFEAYEFQKLQFVFVPYVSTATNGWNAMNFDYNPQEESSTQFPTKQSFTDYDGSVQCNAWEAFQMPVRCPNLEGPRVRTIRTGAISGQYDLHNYDHGQFNFAVGASTGTAAIGTLYVCYTVSLSRPRISSLGSGQNSLAAAAVNYTTGVAKTSVFGAQNLLMGTVSDSTMGLYPSASGSIGVSNAQINFSSSTSNFIQQFSQNTFLISVNIQGSGMSLSSANVPLIPSSVSYTIQQTTDIAVDESGNNMMGWGVIQMTGVGDKVLFALSSANIAATSVTAIWFNVAQIPYGLTLTSKEKGFEKYMKSLISKMLFEKRSSSGQLLLKVEEDEESKEPDSPVVVNDPKKALAIALSKVSTRK